MSSKKRIRVVDSKPRIIGSAIGAITGAAIGYIAERRPEQMVEGNSILKMMLTATAGAMIGDSIEKAVRPKDKVVGYMEADYVDIDGDKSES